MQDLTMRSYLDLAVQIGRKELKEGSSLERGSEGERYNGQEAQEQGVA